MMTPALDSKLFESIGKITVNFEALSYMVELGIWILLFGNGIQEKRTGQIVTAERSFGRNVDLFSCLYKHRYAKQSHKVLTDLCGNLHDIEEKRNTVTHSRWTLVDMFEQVIRMKTTAKRKGIGFQFEQMSLTEIATFADEIARTSEQLAMFVSKFCTKPFETAV
jgi:hypothetical protein